METTEAPSTPPQMLPYPSVALTPNATPTPMDGAPTEARYLARKAGDLGQACLTLHNTRCAHKSPPPPPSSPIHLFGLVSNNIIPQLCTHTHTHTHTHTQSQPGQAGQWLTTVPTFNLAQQHIQGWSWQLRIFNFYCAKVSRLLTLFETEELG